MNDDECSYCGNSATLIRGKTISWDAKGKPKGQVRELLCDECIEKERQGRLHNEPLLNVDNV